MSDHIYLMRVKIQFANHVKNLLDKFNFVMSIEEVDVGEISSYAYDIDVKGPKWPTQSHTLFLVKCHLLNRDEEKKKFHAFIEQCIALDLILRVDKFEISKEEIWKNY